MSDAFYILFAMTVLSITGWLDDVFLRLHIGKPVFTVLSAFCMIICAYKLNIQGIEISPASFLLFLVPTIHATVTEKPEPLRWLTVSSLMLIFLYAMLYIFGALDITIAVMMLSFVCALLPLPCIFSMSVCSAVSFIAYLLSLFGDFYYYINNTPTCESALLAQVVSFVTILSVSYVKSIASTRKKQIINQ